MFSAFNHPNYELQGPSLKSNALVKGNGRSNQPNADVFEGGANQSIWRKPSQTQEELANSTQREAGLLPP